tara:strand:+ start:7606 stop:8928 length:1323 start_codon:yes stop_codon:yes gene_type:complete
MSQLNANKKLSDSSTELQINNLSLKCDSNITSEIIPEIRIGVIGNVDSGKSTTIGVISKDKLDNGKGSARKAVMKHNHEKESGRTSDITQQYIKYEDRIIDFIDLAGHEKYLKTTAYGINGYLVDYGALVINANSGILKMTKEHIGLIFTLKIPTFIIFTKVDITPKNIIDQNLKQIKDFITTRLKKKTDIVKDTNIEKVIQNYKNDIYSTIPIFPTSNVTGFGLSNLKHFIKSLDSYVEYNKFQDNPTSYLIDRKYQVEGVGLVVSGVLKSGIINKGDVLSIGPFNGQFLKIIIRNIHDNFRNNINKLVAGQGGCLNIKPVSNKINIKRNMIKKGLRVINHDFYVKNNIPIITNKFTAEIKILHHPTTITIKYNPTLHCGPVVQTVKIKQMDKEFLRTNDKANVVMEFKYRPEIIEKGSKFVFRDGSTKGIGIIKEILP